VRWPRAAPESLTGAYRVAAAGSSPSSWTTGGHVLYVTASPGFPQATCGQKTAAYSVDRRALGAALALGVWRRHFALHRAGRAQAGSCAPRGPRSGAFAPGRTRVVRLAPPLNQSPAETAYAAEFASLATLLDPHAFTRRERRFFGAFDLRHRCGGSLVYVAELVSASPLRAQGTLSSGHPRPWHPDSRPPRYRNDWFALGLTSTARGVAPLVATPPWARLGLPSRAQLPLGCASLPEYDVTPLRRRSHTALAAVCLVCLHRDLVRLVGLRLRFARDGVSSR